MEISPTAPWHWSPHPRNFDYEFASTLRYPDVREGLPAWHVEDLRHELRILHPAYLGNRSVSWQIISESSRTHMTPRVGFGEIANSTSANYRKGEIYDRDPTTGAVPMNVVEIIRDHLDFSNCLALSWEGNADISAQFPAEDYPRIPIVDYGLFLPIEWVEHPVELPITRFNYLWPRSRNWLIASGVDSQDTILVAADLDLITRVGSDVRLETLRLSNSG